MLDAQWRLIEDKSNAKAAVFYKWSELVGTRPSRSDFLWLPDVGRGLTHLSQMRVGAFLTGVAEARAPARADAAIRTEICRFCGGGEHADARETYAHLVVSCPAWVAQRRDFGLRDYIHSAYHVLRHSRQRCTGSNLLTLLLGGKVGGAKLADWDFIKDHGVHYVSDSDDMDSSSEHDEEDGGESADPMDQSETQGRDRCCYAMARFLNAVRLRRFVLDKLPGLPDAGEV